MWWHTMTRGKGSEGETGEWSRYPVLITLSQNMVYPALLPLMRTPRLPVVDWTVAPSDLNGLVLFAERRNLVSARVPSHFKRSLLTRMSFGQNITNFTLHYIVEYIVFWLSDILVSIRGYPVIKLHQNTVVYLLVLICVHLMNARNMDQINRQ